MRVAIKKYAPDVIVDILRASLFISHKIRRNSIRLMRGIFEYAGLVVASKNDYYSPLPSVTDLGRTISRWKRPSSLRGINYDIETYKRRFCALLEKYGDEFRDLPPYEECKKKGFGPGMPQTDVMTLYFLLRELKPRRYYEVGSGLSTCYAHFAALRNKQEGHDLRIRCFEPFPYKQLYEIPEIEIVNDEVQNVDPLIFCELEENDILFIDSTHSVKIDGDVPFLLLEVAPLVKKGVFIHIHDIHFPYNIPYPAEYWVLGEMANKNLWPVFWTEAMLLQAFLSFNDSYELFLSLPMVRHFDERFLKERIGFYKSINEDPDIFSSLWIKKTHDSPVAK